MTNFPPLPVLLFVGLGSACVFYGWWGIRRGDTWGRFWQGILFTIAGAIAFAFGCDRFISWNLCRHEHSVTQKDLTSCALCNTVSDMANALGRDKQIAVIGALSEGSSIRSIERITGVHRDTIMRLGVKIGEGCATLLDAKMRNLDCHYLQFDEVWGFIGKKERHLRPGDDPQYGDVWTFCAIDADTKIVPSFRCGNQDLRARSLAASRVEVQCTYVCCRGQESRYG